MNSANILDEAFPESFCDTQNRRFWELLVLGLAAEKIHPVDLCTSPTMPGVPTSPLPHTLLLGLQIDILFHPRYTDL